MPSVDAHEEEEESEGEEDFPEEESEDEEDFPRKEREEDFPRKESEDDEDSDTRDANATDQQMHSQVRAKSRNRPCIPTLTQICFPV